MSGIGTAIGIGAANAAIAAGISVGSNAALDSVSNASARRNTLKFQRQWYGSSLPSQRLDFERKQMEQQYDIQTNFSKARDQMIKAGMNPNLIYGNGITGTNVGQPSGEFPTSSGAAHQVAATADLLDMYKFEKQISIDKQNADTQLLLAQAQAGALDHQNSVADAEAALKGFQLAVKRGDKDILNTPEYKQLDAAINKLGAETGELNTRSGKNVSESNKLSIEATTLQEKYKRMMDEDFDIDLWMKNHPVSREAYRYMKAYGITTADLLNFIASMVQSVGIIGARKMFMKSFGNSPVGKQFEPLLEEIGESASSTSSPSVTPTNPYNGYGGYHGRPRYRGYRSSRGAGRSIK